MKKVRNSLLIFIICITFSSCSSLFWIGVLQGATSYLSSPSPYNYSYNTYASTNAQTSEYEKDLQVEDDGFSWYRMETRGTYLKSIGEYLTDAPYGAMDKSGKILVPRQYDGILYYNGYFIAQKNNKEAAYTKDGTCIIPLSRGYTNILASTEGFGVYIDNAMGLCSSDGKEIISPSKGFTSIYDSKGADGFEYYEVKKDGKSAILSSTGNYIIPLSRGYSKIYRMDDDIENIFYRVYKGELEGYCDAAGSEIVPPIYDGVYTRTHSGIKYFSVTLNGYEGILYSDGTILISPDKYSSILLFKTNIGDYFSVKQNGFEGILNSKGETIISPNQYNNIYLSNSDDVYWFSVVKNGYCGIVDVKGKELIPPNKYKHKGETSNDLWYISYNKDKNRFVYKLSGSKQETTLNYSLKYLSKDVPSFGTLSSIRSLAGNSKEVIVSSPTKSITELPIAKGTYIRSGQAYVRETGQYTSADSDWTMLVEFFDEHIIVGGVVCPLIETRSDGSREYKSSMGTYIVSPSYDMRLESTSFGYTFVYAMRIKGSIVSGENQLEDGKIMYESSSGINHNHTQVTSGTVNYNSSTTSSTNNIEQSTKELHKCKVCDGKGWVVANTVSFGSTEKKWCAECNSYVYVGHYHEQCPSCKGKGYW